LPRLKRFKGSDVSKCTFKTPGLLFNADRKRPLTKVRFPERAAMTAGDGQEEGVMGRVLSFQAPARSTRRIEPSVGPKGQILFFTGVRYERHPEEPKRPAGRRQRRSRGA
jgi:hypothetical protein